MRLALLISFFFTSLLFWTFYPVPSSAGVTEELLPCGLPAGKVIPLNLCGKGPESKAGDSLGIHYGTQPLLTEMVVDGKVRGLPPEAEDLDALGLLDFLVARAEVMAVSGVDEKGLLAASAVWATLMIDYSFKPFLQAQFDPMWNSRLDTIGWEIDSLVSDLRAAGFVQKDGERIGGEAAGPGSADLGSKAAETADRIAYVAELARSLSGGVSSAEVEKKLKEVLEFQTFSVFRGTRVDFFIGIGVDGRPTGVATCFAEKGAGGPMRLVVGIDPSGRVAGVSIVEHAETWQDFDTEAYLKSFRGLDASGAGANEPPGERRPMILAGTSAIRFGVKRSLFVFSRFSGVLDEIGVEDDGNSEQGGENSEGGGNRDPERKNDGAGEKDAGPVGVTK